METLYRDTLRSMSGQPLEACQEALNGLTFLQEVMATALWKHHCFVGDVLESFVREFDRLDLPTERATLHARAQAGDLS